MKPADPVKLLEGFLADGKKSIRGFAKEIGMDSTFLNRILLRKRRPGTDAASRIEHGTDGKVPARLWGDWFRVVDEEPTGTRKAS